MCFTCGSPQHFAKDCAWKEIAKGKISYEGKNPSDNPHAGKPRVQKVVEKTNSPPSESGASMSLQASSASSMYGSELTNEVGGSEAAKNVLEEAPNFLRRMSLREEQSNEIIGLT